ncbi:MAG: hypothetical protein JWP27_382, partial [Flaviaesturariibacter sp.]|nr:hypothetical protein [Flaviaesturariibacter sp.]
VLFARPSYYAAAWVPCILSLGPIIYSLSCFTQVGCYVKKNMKPVATSVLLAGALSVCLYFVLIPSLGKEGAALATVCGQVIIPLFIYWKGNKYYPVRYNARFLATVIVTSLLLGIGGRQIVLAQPFVLVAIKFVIIIVYFLISLWQVSVHDKELFKGFVAALSNLKNYRNVRNRRNHIVS